MNFSVNAEFRLMIIFIQQIQFFTMSQQTKSQVSEKPYTVSFWRSRNVTTTTTTQSPSKNQNHTFHRTNSFDRSYCIEHSSDLNKKSIYEVKYFLQVQKKKMRNALISQKFEESNVSHELTRNMANKGMKGSKIQNKRGFRKNKYAAIEDVGCMQPIQSHQKLQSGLAARHNKPNLMYNLDLFRKKYTKQAKIQKKMSFDSLIFEGNRSNSIITGHKKMRFLKTQQDSSPFKTLSERQKY